MLSLCVCVFVYAHACVQLYVGGWDGLHSRLSVPAPAPPPGEAVEEGPALAEGGSCRERPAWCLLRPLVPERRCGVQDMSRLGRDMTRCVLVDDTPLAFFRQPNNGIPVLCFRQAPPLPARVCVRACVRAREGQVFVPFRDGGVGVRWPGGGGSGAWRVLCPAGISMHRACTPLALTMQ